MRLLPALLLLLVAGCTSPKMAYLNATEPYDGDLRRMLLQLERRQEEKKLEWPTVERQTIADIERLRQANKVFSQGPPGSEEMRQAALDLIVKLVPPLQLTHETAVHTAASALTPGEREVLQPQIAAAKASLATYSAARHKFSGE